MFNTNEQNLEEHAKILEMSYRACLGRLENLNARLPYNLIITKEWMLVVNRSRPSTGPI